MCDGLLAVKEEGVGRPDVAGQQIVQREHLHGTFKAEPLILPALAEEHVNGVFLWKNKRSIMILSQTFIFILFFFFLMSVFPSFQNLCCRLQFCSKFLISPVGGVNGTFFFCLQFYSCIIIKMFNILRFILDSNLQISSRGSRFSWSVVTLQRIYNHNLNMHFFFPFNTLHPQKADLIFFLFFWNVVFHRNWNGFCEVIYSSMESPPSPPPHNCTASCRLCEWAACFTISLVF